MAGLVDPAPSAVPSIRRRREKPHDARRGTALGA